MAAFNPNRYGFCVIGKKIIVMADGDRNMETQKWMEETLRLSGEDSEYAVRGYFLPNRIQFFTGPLYTTSPDVDGDIIEDALSVYIDLYGTTTLVALQTPVYNGVWPGLEGDTWPPVLQWNYDSGRWEVAKP